MTDSFTKQLHLVIDGKVGSVVGMTSLKGTFKDILSFNDKAVAKAEWAARQQARLSDKATMDLKRALAEQTRLTDQKIRAEIRLEEESARGRLRWRQYYLDQVKRLNAEQILSDQRVASAQAASQASVLGARQAGAGIAGARYAGYTSTGLSMLGSASLGLGVGALTAGVYTARRAANWQTFQSQQFANSPMTAAERRQFPGLSWQTATGTGANPQDVLLSLRYGSELGLGGGLDRRYLRAALALGLPTGGTAAIPPSLMALATVRKNFRGLGNQPNAVANMILAASQNSAGVSAPDFVSSIPQLLTIAGHIGGPDQFQQALAITAALTSTGMPLDEAQTQAKNIVAKVFKPSPSTWKYIKQLKQGTGIDVSGDFGAQALQQKGLAGVINNLASKHLGPTDLGYLFPNLRGYFGALGLTGNQNASFRNILQRVNQAPGQNPIGTNMRRYMGLASTKEAEAQQKFNKAMVDFGKDALPVLTQFIKDATPFVHWLDQIAKSRDGTVKTILQLTPALIGVGVAVKGLNFIGAGKAITGLTMLFADMLGGEAAAGGAGALAAVAGGSAEAGSVGVLATMGPVGLAIAGVVTAGLAVKLMYDHWSGFHTWADNVATDFQKVGNAAQTTAGNILGTTLGKLGAAALAPTALIGGAAMTPILIPGLGIAYLMGKVDKHGKPVPITGPGTSAPVQMARAAGRRVHFDPGAHPLGSAFGMPAGDAFTSGPLNMAWIKGSTAAAHWDFGAGPGGRFDVNLPGGKGARYKLIEQKRYNDSRGLTETWQTPNGGRFTLMHLSIGTSVKPGTWVTGDTGVGLSGWSGLDKIYGSGASAQAHLHVGADVKAESYFYGATGGMGWKGAFYAAGQANAGVDWSKVPPPVARWKKQIIAAAKKYGVSAQLIASVIWSESSGNPTAINVSQGHQYFGLMQIQDANLPGLGIPWSQRFDPMANIMGGTRLLAGNINTSKGNLHTALNAYSGGGADQKSQRMGGKTYFQFTTGNAKAWTGTGGLNNFTPPGTSGITAGAVAGVISSRFGPSPNPSKMSPADRADYRTLLEQEISLSHADDMAAAQAIGAPNHLLTQLHNRYLWAQAHPFQWAGRGGRTKTLGAYGGAIFAERNKLRGMEAKWHGINVSQLPMTGNGMYNQQNYLRFEIKKDALLRQISDNTAKQYAITHRMSDAWLKQQLKQDRKTQQAADAAARARLTGGGETNFVRMPELMYRCKAEAEANIIRRRAENHGHSAATSLVTVVKVLRKIEMNTSTVNGTGAQQHPHMGSHHALHQIGGPASAVLEDARLNGYQVGVPVGY